MLNLAKVKLPDCIECGGKFFNLKTDFRIWLGFSQTVNEKSAVVDDVDFVYSDEIPSAEIKAEAFKQLLNFYMPKNELPRKTSGEDSGAKILDYTIDADYIYAAFLEQYGIDLLKVDEKGHAVELHWHKFLALLSGLHGTKLNEIMSWRGWTGETKTEYGKQMAKLRNAWELPSEDREKIQEDLEKFNALFEKKD